jgi:sterol desaturase/sphingolipid hydroxylase (fatty acid hydroxylase superfamily)
MPDLLHLAIPAFVLLLLAEVIFDTISKRELFETKDTFSSLAMGVGNVVVGLATKGVILGVYLWIYQFRIITLDSTKWWVWILLLFADDFSYYWFHRTSHSCRYFWASHVVHHSSQRYNLSTALRQTWTGNLSGSFLFWAWMPLVGFHPIMILSMQAISLIYQFWIHTETIVKMPYILELVLNTPSHHRVHHGSDIKYLDRNHAGILIIWDRMFGTFVKEQETPTYGLTRNIDTYNPFKIAFNEWRDIFIDLRKSRSLRQFLGYLFGPPGWSHDGTRRTTDQLRAASTKPLASTLPDRPA